MLGPKVLTEAAPAATRPVPAGNNTRVEVAGRKHEVDFAGRPAGQLALNLLTCTLPASDQGALNLLTCMWDKSRENEGNTVEKERRVAASGEASESRLPAASR